MNDLVLVGRPGSGIAEIVLNRPKRRNALIGPMVDQLAAAIEQTHADPDVSVVVIRGAGGAFCSGVDLTEFAADPPPPWRESFSTSWRGVHERLFDSDRIVVGALERAAVNAGAALALACDFLVVGQDAFLQVGEIQQGMAAPMNMAWLRLRHSEALAARIALLGDRIGGQALADLGLAYSCVPDQAVVETTNELAERLAGHDPDGVRRIKVSLRRSVVAESASEWFDRVVASDPQRDRPFRPVAATDR